MLLPGLDETPPAPPQTGVIGPIHQGRDVREWALVLSSMGVAHAVKDAHPGWYILVAESDHARAVEAIRLYQAENANWPPRRPRELLPYARSLAAPLLMVPLVLFYLVTGPASSSSGWFARGTASSDLIVHGEIWRAVTALTLHADALHVFGNALTGSIFLSAVNRRLGDGKGPLLMLLAGTLGNGMNAFYHRTGHLSIGASTAVFGAVGILVATQLALDRHDTRRSWLERAAPIVGGLALLGMLGASPHSDLFAHLFGLVGGLAVGLAALFLQRLGSKPNQHGPLRPSSTFVQLASAVVTFVIVIAAWTLALRPPHV
ncbi:MAG TPA: rhomboid family intramembrane serine protease [Polyangiaceae bacterium]|nr:rhomboid family intramembrane serine protease [Polyangiaceae bacterium]